MTLTLQIENFNVLDDGGPVSITVPQSGVHVGRRSGMDWVLPDASRYISGHHFDISFDGQTWWLKDCSTNGTFLQGRRHRLDGPHALQQGDRFQVGQYVIVAVMDRIAGEANMAPLPEHRVDSPVIEPAGDDPWAVSGSIYPPVDVMPPDMRRRQADFADDFVAFPTPSAPEQEPPPAPQQSQPIPQSSPPSRPLTQPPVRQGDGSAFVQAFCDGAGLPAELAAGVQAEDLARALGSAARAATGQLMLALQERSNARHFTRSGERTMRAASDNNPLKFLPDAEQALDALFLRPRAGFLTGSAGFEEALGDLRRHQNALFAALQPALLELVQDLDPGAVEAEAGGGALMGNRKSRAWEIFTERWDRKTASENGMLDEFIRLFAQAYRQAHDREGSS